MPVDELQSTLLAVVRVVSKEELARHSIVSEWMIELTKWTDSLVFVVSLVAGEGEIESLSRSLSDSRGVVRCVSSSVEGMLARLIERDDERMDRS